MRPVKAFDVLIEALAILKASGRPVSVTIAGEGPDGDELRRQAERLQIADLVRFAGYRPAREAFAMGRMLVIPSRAESLPYVVLEAAAAGMPIIATRVGGIPEIFGPESDQLIAADDVDALAGAIRDALDAPAQVSRVAQLVKARVRQEFSLAAMVDGGLPPIAKRSRCENLRNSHNQFLNFIHYFAAQTARGGAFPPGRGRQNACCKCPSPSTARFSIPLPRCCPPSRRCRANARGQTRRRSFLPPR